MSEKDFTDIFSDNLRAAMEEAGISAINLAYESGLDRSTVSRYLNNQHTPTLKAVINMAYVLNVEINDLVPTYELIK